MGLTARFLRDQIDGILEFSGLREKVNHRLRTLSTGQKMRLGFAISTSVQHDIIMMDEWVGAGDRSEEHTSELQSLMRISYAVFCLKKKKNNTQIIQRETHITTVKRRHHTLT